MNNERLMQVLLSPVVSEKSAHVADRSHQYAFQVVTDATKREVGRAVELMFGVKVEKVQMVNVKGKAKRFGRVAGRRAGWKKAYVRLKPGFDIDFAGGA